MSEKGFLFQERPSPGDDACYETGCSDESIAHRFALCGRNNALDEQRPKPGRVASWDEVLFTRVVA